jgi:uncharacterized membrane protein YfbV (UPF0208 family)
LKTRLNPTTAELKTRQKFAFLILDPQVQVVKNSPTAQIVFGTVVSAAVLTGNWATAAVVAGCWFGSKPLTHAVPGGVAGVGLVDGKLLTAIGQLQSLQAEPVCIAASGV